jgi:small subunit ribosomal protein S11e
MAATLSVAQTEQQAEKAFQRQPIFNNAKAKNSKKVTKTKRWYKDVGLGIKVSRLLRL